MENEISELVAKFCGVTTANPEQAKFYLESSEWQIESALQLYFETDGSGGLQEGGPTPMNLADYDLTEDEVMVNAVESESMAPEENSTNNAWEATSMAATADPNDPPPPPAQRRASAPASKPKDKEKGSARKSVGSRGPVMTLGDLGKHRDSDSDSEGQEYYTGGEKSGMVVQDPNKKPNRRDVEAIFERVRQLGAQEGPVAEPPRPAAPTSSSFSGTSRTLTGETRQQEHVPSETGLRASPPDPIVHTIHFWRNGFTVNEGPLRRLDDPLNLPFLESINRSECPRELEPQDRSIPVNVNLVKRTDEDWQAPLEPKYVPFKGQGHTLGTKPARPEDVTSSANTNDVQRPAQGLVIDDAKPATSIQLRLSDGTRMVARFNTTHTVADIRGFIDAARPGGTGPYQLQTMGFPPVKLTDSKQTIEGAGLLNAVVIQKA